MREQFKTVLLIGLIFSSAFLTWQLWTHQPQYDYVLPTEYVAQEGLADRMDVIDLIRPEKIIHHDGEVTQKVSFPNMFAYQVVYGEMVNWEFTYQQQIHEGNIIEVKKQLLESEGIEIYFPAAIPNSFLSELFQIETGYWLMPMVERIWLYQTEEENIYAVFIADDGQSMMRFGTNITQEELTLYKYAGYNNPNSYKNIKFFDTSEEINEHNKLYLPEENVSVSSYQYSYQHVPLELMKSYLFVDATLVRQIESRANISFHSDGTSGLQHDHEQMIMHFFHPLQELPAEQMQDQDMYIQNSAHFVNQHRGWDMKYALDEIGNDVFDNRITMHYRQYLQDKNTYYPVYSGARTEGQHSIIVDIQLGKVVGYQRPLIDIAQKIQQEDWVLPSGPRLLETLEEERVPLENINDIFIGYKSIIEETYIQYVPHWVIKFNDDGEHLFIQGVSESRGGDEL